MEIGHDGTDGVAELLRGNDGAPVAASDDDQRMTAPRLPVRGKDRHRMTAQSGERNADQLFGPFGDCFLQVFANHVHSLSLLVFVNEVPQMFRT